MRNAPSHEACLAALLYVEKLLRKTAPAGAAKRKALAMATLNKINDYEVMTHNLLNRDAGEFPIAARDAGGCCDPATERYHSM